MTQQEFIQEFRNYPQEVKSDVLEKLKQIYEENPEKESKTSESEKRTAYLRLRGALKMEKPPKTKEEVQKIYYEHLKEKHK